ncbi:Uncharacterized protein YbeQ [Wickerhamiella sorbophila]|uniref:Uncharacterized protein YbeQ n=1 Tax=Wickerhamiella sorbophila TaxID=45607 RepID=A0A2T0FFB6_9ASCO|nr:Uncharacterized protein YbeQ [Wickerhamiella sorbophila]PRT53693.1 Uncharacterized protein YbeQ [Wickerhamiella sorbophila]
MYENNKFTTRIKPNVDAPLRPPKRTRSLPSIIRRATKFKWSRTNRSYSTGNINSHLGKQGGGDGFNQRLDNFSKTFNVPEQKVGPIGPHVTVEWVPEIEPSISESSKPSSISNTDNTERMELMNKLLSTSSSVILALMDDTQSCFSDHVSVPPSTTPEYFQNPEYFSRGYLRGSQYSNRAVGLGVKLYKKGKYAEASKQYRAAASQGNMYGMHNLGVMQLYGQGMAADYAAAKECFVYCAHKELTASMSQLGYIYLYGKGVEVDIARAFSWFKRAADRGNPYAQFQLAGICYRGTPFLSRNTRTAAKLLAQSAMQDYAPALYNLGAMYFTGSGVPQDFVAAATLYKKAAKMNYPQALTNLGAMYACGVGVQRNFARAISYTKKAVQFSVREALHNMADAYAHGQGVDRNLAKAVEFYFRAAQAGDAEAEYSLACMFLQFDRLDKTNWDTGNYWMKRAADHGSINAQKTLSVSAVGEREVRRLAETLAKKV